MEPLENRQLLDAASIVANVAPDAFVASAAVEDPEPVDIPDLEEGTTVASISEASIVKTAGELDNQYAVSWDAVEDAAAYRVKISKDGGETFMTYVKSTEDTSFTAKGVYNGRAYIYRIHSLDANGKASADYLETTIAPVGMSTALTYTDGDTINVTLKGAVDDEGASLVSAEIHWFEVTEEGDVEIVEAANQLEYTPTSQNDVKIVLTGSGNSEGSVATSVVEYTDDPIVTLTNYNVTSRNAKITWAVDPNVAVKGYYVKMSKDGGDWKTYQKVSIANASTPETYYNVNVKNTDGSTTTWASSKNFTVKDGRYSINVNGLYVGREYVFRVYTIPEGSSLRDYNIVDFTPFTVSGSAEAYETGTPISVSLNGRESAEATYSWFYNTADGLVEIEGTAGLAEITPEAPNYPIVAVVTGDGASKGEEQTVEFAALGAKISLAGYDEAERAATIAWEPMLDAASYAVEISTDDGETFTTIATDVAEASVLVADIDVAQNYSFSVTGYNANGDLVGTSQIGTVSPFGFAVSSEVYDDNETVSVTITAVEGAGADIVWYYVDENGEYVEIEEAHGLTEYVPTVEADILVTAVGTGLAAGQTASAPVYYKAIPEGGSSIVTTLEDVVNKYDGVISLREAIEAYGVDGSVITLDESLAGQTVVLNGAPIAIANNMTISGISIDANGASGVFAAEGSEEAPLTIALSDVQIANAQSENGAISVANVDLTLDGVTIKDSTATSKGGAIYANGGSVAISKSTLSGNAAEDGGAIYAEGGATITIENSLVVENSATNGAAIAIADESELALANVTVTANAGSSAVYVGEGAEASIVNSIVAANGETTADIVSENGVVNGAYVLSNFSDWSETSEGAIAYDSSIALFAADYQLVISTSSQALDAGSAALVASDTDFAGATRVMGRSVDLGAFEAEVEDASTVVTTTADVVDLTDGQISLREALTIYAKDGDTITFDASLAGQTISLANKQIDIATSVTIDASATPITIDAHNNSRIFAITAGSVSIDGVNFLAGKSAGSGGAITATDSALSISNGTISGSNAKGFGGAINLAKGSLELNNVLVVENAAIKGGGAIYAKATPVTLKNVTIANNDSTAGAALQETSSEVNLYNTIVAENVGGDIITAGTINAYNALSSFTAWSNEGAVAYEYDADAPLFADAYNLERVHGNQAIDKGDDQYVTVSADLNGDARIKGNRVDLGVYEADIEDASTVVTTLDDVVNTTDYLVSLREAIEKYAVAGDTIAFDASLNGQTITLGGSQIVISKNMTIDASALANGITVSGNNANRVFRITASDVTIDNVDFANGARANASENGGAIYAATNAGFTLKNSSITNCNAVNGGAIYGSTNSSITLDSVAVSNSSATTQGGAIYLGTSAALTATNATFTGNAGGNRGGVLSAANGNTVSLSGVTATGNSATRGAFLYTTGATNVTVSGSTINNNTGAEKGGVIYSSATGTITLNDTSFSGNNGGGNGAVIEITNGTVNGSNVSFKNNTSTGNGGALFTEGGTISFNGATITGNSAVSGGAFSLSAGSINLTNANISSNRATGSGAAIYAPAGSYTLTNTLLTGNSGGGYVVYTGATANMVNITLANNSSMGVYATGTTTLRNSIVWGNSASNFQMNGGTFTVSNVLTQSGRSSGSSQVSGTFWESDNDAPFDGNFQLMRGWISEDGISPINSGNDSYNSTTLDLAGNPRKVGTIDLGAYENQSGSRAVLDEVFAEGIDDLFFED